MSDNEKRWGFLPDEILTHIFHCLPIKSIIACTSVSKTWKSLIKNPTFISTHFRHSRKNLLLFKLPTQPFEMFGTIPTGDREVYTLLHDDDFTKQQQHTRLDFPFHGPDLESHCPVFRVVGTCDGLLCLSDDLITYIDIFYPWNPCVRKILRLPYPNVTFGTHGGFDASLVFGFGPKTNDYKVVRVVTLVDTLDLRKDRPKVEVYSLSTNKWRMVKASLVPRCVLDGRAPQAFVNGALHWRVFTRADDGSFHHFVLVFDLGDEVFSEMQLPQLLAYTYERMRLYSPISTCRNSIAFFHQDYNSHCLDIWVMKQYGVVSSWTKALSLTMTCQGGFLSRDYIRRAVGFTRSGKIVLEMGGGHLVSQDLETKESKDLGIIGYKYNFVDAYVESLILLDKAANGVVTY